VSLFFIKIKTFHNILGHILQLFVLLNEPMI